MGELHLDILRDRMIREFGVQANMGKPQVAYKETILKAAGGEGTHDRMVAGKRQFGRVQVSLQPLPRGGGFGFRNVLRSGILPKAILEAVEDGVREALDIGQLASFPMTDVQATLEAVDFREDEASPLAFKIAASLAVKNAALKAVPVLLEPVAALEVVAADEYLGDIVGDLNARRGKVEGLEMRGGSRVVKAQVPLAEMFGYATILRTLTQGRGVFSMEFHAYETMPLSVMSQIIARIEGRASYES
jgi:elongation factor G